MGGFRAGQVSASAVERAFLEPSMEARVHNLDQYDPSPGIDSQLERIRALAHEFPPSSLREKLLAEVDAAIISNVREGREVLGIAGSADQLVTDLRRIEHGPNSQALGAKAIARYLREPLALLSSPEGTPAGDLVHARQRLHDAIDAVPLLMLMSPAVEHELGQTKYAGLVDIVNKKGAGGSTPSDAHEREAARHDGL
jgi:DNA-binding transcriptional ArsR family regulator